MTQENAASLTELPWRVFRQAAFKAMEQAAPAVDRLVATEGYARVMNRTLRTVLDATIPMRALSNQLGEFAAEWLNVPTRSQLVELAKRINHVEILLDDLDVKSAEMLAMMKNSGSNG